MTIENLPSVDYDGVDEYGSESLFAIWESGQASQMPAPLSVRLPRYRRLIVELIKRHGAGLPASVLSIGAGNGFTEAELAAVGFDVLATDQSRVALEYCKNKGLKTAFYEFPKEPPVEFNKYDIVYCDGVLGHLWRPKANNQEFWLRFAELCKPFAFLLLSNDLSESDIAPTLGVASNPHARFFRPPAGWFAQDAQASKLWKSEAIRVLRYRRYGRLRRREILILRRLLMHEGKE